jgi:hypothetical protein
MKIAIRNVILSTGGLEPPPGMQKIRNVYLGDIFQDDDPLVLRRPELFEPYDGPESSHPAARMRQIRDEIRRMEETEMTPCEACQAAIAAYDASISALLDEYWALDAELPGGAERAVVRAAHKAVIDAEETMPEA